MLLSYHDYRLDIVQLHDLVLFINVLSKSDSGCVPDGFLSGLLGILVGLDGEWKFGLKTRMVTPVTLHRLPVSLLLFLSSTEGRVIPGNSTSEVVPVNITVDGDETEDTPQNPSHFADHPDICLTHVVRDMEHHLYL